MVSLGIAAARDKTQARSLRFDAVAARAMALLACEGAALGLFLRQMAGGVGWVSYVRENASSAEGRAGLLLWMAVGSTTCVVVGAAWGLRRRSAVGSASRALCPTLLLSVVPELLDCRPWAGREVSCLLSIAVVALVSIPIFRTAGRGFYELGVGEWSVLPRVRRELASAHGRAGTRSAVVGASAMLAFYIAFFTVRVHHKLGTSTFDLGIFDNLFWNALHGAPFHAPGASAAATSFLAIHATFLLYAFLPFYALYPHPETLLVLQAVLVAGSAVPLYLLAETPLGHLPAAAITACYLLYPPLQSPAFYDFHFLTTAPFFVLWAAYFLVRRRTVPFWLFVALSLACREDVALGLIGVGAGLALSSPWRRRGVALAAAAAVYSAIVKFAVMPRFGPASFLWIYRDLVPPGASAGFLGVLATIVGNPLYTLGTVFVRDKLVYSLHLFTPTAFLPLRVPRAWWLFFPGILVTLLSSGNAPVVNMHCQYVAHFTPYVFAACVAYFALTRRGRAIDRPALAAMLLATVLSTTQFGALQQGAFFGGFQRIDFSWSRDDGDRLQRLRTLAARIPQSMSVAASEPEGAHLGDRRDLYALKDEVRGADCILFSLRSLGVGGTRGHVVDALAGEYGLADREGEFLLLERGAPTRHNGQTAAEVLLAP